VFIEFCDILLNIPLFPPFLRGTFDTRFINRTQVYRFNTTSQMKKTLFFFFLLFPILVYGQENKEHFDSFIQDFSSDSSFQMSRIQFPLPFKTMNHETYEEMEMTLSEDQWNFHSVLPNHESFTQTYDNFNMEMDDSGERVFSLTGNSNGINIYYYFKRVGGKWFLVKFEDTST